MSDRLEEMDRVVDDLLNNRGELTNFVNDYYLQAERVQELEKIKESHIEELGYVDERLLEAEHQNKCYREALEFYDNEEIYEFETIVSDCDIEVESKILEDGGQKARKALEESE